MNTHEPRQLCHRIGIAILLVIFLLVSASMLCSGAAYTTNYVSLTGNGTAGTNWATAWTHPTRINWSVVTPPCVIWIDGGPGGMDYSGETFTNMPINEDGTTAEPNYIKRSLESGHDGFVKWPSYVDINSMNWILDGGTNGAENGKSYATVGQIPGNAQWRLGYSGGGRDADGSEFRNVHLIGQNWPEAYAATSLNVYSVNCAIRYMKFTASAGEDPLGIITWGNFTVDSCWFKDLTEGFSTVHRDAISIYPGTLPGYTVTVQNTIFENIAAVITEVPPSNFNPGGGGNTGGLEIRNCLFTKIGNRCYNLWDGGVGTKQFVKFVGCTFSEVNTISGIDDAVTSVTLSNGAFRYMTNGTADGGSGFTGDWSNSAYETGTTGANTANGNGIGSLNFLNVADIDGTDNIPFTADDGFNPQATSTVILNRGATIAGQTELDIRKNVRSSPDAGAYEYNGAPPPPPTPPIAPGSLVVSNPTTNSLNLAWADNSTDETQFVISRSTSSGGTFSDNASVGAGVTTYQDTGLAASQTYYYKVRATNAGGDSSNSNTANGTTSQVSAPASAGDVGGVFFRRR